MIYNQNNILRTYIDFDLEESTASEFARIRAKHTRQSGKYFYSFSLFISLR